MSCLRANEIDINYTGSAITGSSRDWLSLSPSMLMFVRVGWQQQPHKKITDFDCSHMCPREDWAETTTNSDRLRRCVMKKETIINDRMIRRPLRPKRNTLSDLCPKNERLWLLGLGCLPLADSLVVSVHLCRFFEEEVGQRVQAMVLR